jgi:hypothetical protein
MIRTLPLLLGALLLSRSSFAQVDERFENGITTLTNSCWQFNNVNYANRSTDPGSVITGTGSIYSNPPVNNTNYRTVTSPFLNVISNQINFSFDYKLSSVLKTGATRVIEIGLIDVSGNFQSLERITLNETDNTGIKPYSGSKPVTSGIYQFVIKMGGQTGDGNCRLVLDNLTIDAPYYYPNHCNSAPVAADDKFTGIEGGVFNGSTLFANDNDPDGEQLTARLVTNSPDGNVSIHSDGTFTFIPNTDFKGSSTSFTYKVTDNGYMPATSNTAAVTINFEKPKPIIQNLAAFNGKIKNEKVQLNWEMAMNELIERFEIQKSINGSSFITTNTVDATEQTGTEEYTLTEPASASVLQYRLKIISRLGQEEYSPVINLSSKEGFGSQPITILNNPVASKLVFNYAATGHEDLVVSILSNAGVTSYSVKEVANSGINLFQIPVNSLKQGTYILTITNQNGERTSLLFVKM